MLLFLTSQEMEVAAVIPKIRRNLARGIGANQGVKKSIENGGWSLEVRVWIFVFQSPISHLQLPNCIVTVP